MSLFVVGTDTEVGKTVTCAILLARYGRRLPLGYWKPIATGATSDRDTNTIRRLAGSFGVIEEETYLYDPPVSPHLAARWRRHPIDPKTVLREFQTLQRRHPEREFIVEGIGGLLVPLDDDGYMLGDLVRRLHAHCVLVTRSTLGTINHSLLTIEAMRRRKIPIAGVIMNGPRNRDNRDAIERFGEVPVVGELETIKHLTLESIVKSARGVDRRATLKPYLTPNR